jgi:hypothetical protein
MQTAATEDDLLPGRYRDFFAPAHHATVSRWYYETAGEKARKNFKRFVKAILKFDVAAAKGKLRIGFDLDIPAAHAIVSKNGGGIMTEAAREQAVYYVAAASVAERQAFRETMGLIVPPSLTCLHRSKQKLDFAEERKFMRGDLMHRDTTQKVVGKTALRARSAAVEAPCEVVGDGRSQYGFFYAWKVAPKLGLNIQQRAHQATFHGAPWGQYGDSNEKQWVTHMKDDQVDREYGLPAATYESTGKDGGLVASVKLPARRFQNYNDNMSHEMYRAQRLLRKGRELPGERLASLNASASASPSLMRPERNPTLLLPAGPSPIFCR